MTDYGTFPYRNLCQFIIKSASTCPVGFYRSLSLFFIKFYIKIKIHVRSLLRISHAHPSPFTYKKLSVLVYCLSSQCFIVKKEASTDVCFWPPPLLSYQNKKVAAFHITLHFAFCHLVAPAQLPCSYSQLHTVPAVGYDITYLCQPLMHGYCIVLRFSLLQVFLEKPCEYICVCAGVCFGEIFSNEVVGSLGMLIFHLDKNCIIMPESALLYLWLSL